MSNYENYNCGNQYETACACYENRCENRCENRYARNRNGCFCFCSSKVIGFFVVALAVAVGLIFGAVFAEPILEALAAVIVFAVVMAVAVIALLFYRLCEGC